MEPSHIEGLMNREEALGILYGIGPRDFTAEGYQEAISNLRTQDPNLARRVERALAPSLEQEIFPLRGRKWYETSQGMRARLYLLPDNPHLERDVETIRAIFGIPSNELQASREHPLWKRMAKLVDAGTLHRAVTGTLAEHWLKVHRRTALGQPIGLKPAEEDPSGATAETKLLSPEAYQSAEIGAGIDLRRSQAVGTREDIPDWLQRVPTLGPYPEVSVPMDRAAAKLVERYRLPWGLAPNLQFYILTLDKSWLANIDFVLSLVSEAGRESPHYPGFSLTLYGLDDFVTKGEWDRIWEKVIKPKQQALSRQRGRVSSQRRPQGRNAVDLNRLKSGVVLYRKMVQGKRISVEKALSQLTEEGNLDSSILEKDQATARRLVRDLKDLLAPINLS
jgi:hypothetical protein